MASVDPGYGPPPGSTADFPGAVAIPLDQLAQDRIGGPVVPAMGDPAALPPFDPLSPANTNASAKLIYRDIPLVTVQNTWTVDGARGALYGHMQGQFDASGQLCDSILGDDRVMATLGSRRAGLFGREVRFRPGNDSGEAKACLDAWVAAWPRLSGDGAMAEMSDYEIMMGWNAAQIVWDTTTPVWQPMLRPWHPRFSYYDWNVRRYVALSQDGSIAIEPGNAKWVLHSRFTPYRAWVRGAIRAVTEPWMLRHFAFRDMARFSEVHGMPTRIAWTPAAADPAERAQYQQQVSQLGSNTTLLLGRGVDQQNSYGYELVEAGDMAWESFPGLIDRCDMAIVLALLFQNLTTEVKGGAFAATSAHMDIRQSGIQFDGQAWKATLYNQVARPFAFLNFGDADLAPWTEWDIASRDDYSANAERFAKFGTAFHILRMGGMAFNDVEELRKFAAKSFGLDNLPGFNIEPPITGAG